MLADDIYAAMGTEHDFAGCFKLVVSSIEKCQRFVISDDVVEAACQLLRSKPSSLVSALPLCRLPYENIWLEWNGEHPVGADPNAPLRKNAHRVKRMGCWVSGGDRGRIGAAFWIWQDPEGEIAFGGLGTAFAFEADVSGVYRMFNVPVPESNIDIVRDFKADNPHPWVKMVHQSDAEAEAMVQLTKQAAPFPCPWINPFYERLIAEGIGPDDPRLQEMHRGWEHDISGEIPFVFAILMLLNTKNAVEHTRSDLTRLNKARAKAGKVPKFDYSVTRLSLSRGQARLGKLHGLDRQAMQKHLVRGHFKIRRTGVYWWSPFVRGAGALQRRDHYDMKE